MSMVDVKEHLINTINALVNLSPSRNIISQLILLLPEDLAVVEHSYQEATTHYVKAILESLGVKFGDKVERVENSFADALYKNIHKTLDWLDNEYLYREWVGYERAGKMREVRSSLAKLTGIAIDSLLNPYLEWAKLVIRKLLNTYGKCKVLGFLKALLAHNSFRDVDYRRENWQRFLDDVKAKIGANPAEFKDILRFIIDTGEREMLWYKGSRRHTTGYVYLVHSKYHLDPLLEETFRGYYGTHVYENYEYRIRHKETLKKALEEASS